MRRIRSSLMESSANGACAYWGLRDMACGRDSTCPRKSRSTCELLVRPGEPRTQQLCHGALLWPNIDQWPFPCFLVKTDLGQGERSGLGPWLGAGELRPCPVRC